MELNEKNLKILCREWEKMIDPKELTCYNPGSWVKVPVEEFDKKMRETDPYGIAAKEPGSKLDAGKSPLYQGALAYFPRAFKEIANVSLVGAKKYSWRGWESVPDGRNRYSDALVRHLIAEGMGEEIDVDTGNYHAAQVAWNALARLELFLKEKEKNNDNTKQTPNTGV